MDPTSYLSIYSLFKTAHQTLRLCAVLKQIENTPSVFSCGGAGRSELFLGGSGGFFAFDGVLIGDVGGLDVLKGFVLEHLADGQADALGLGVDVQNLHANHVAHVQRVFNLLDAGEGALGDMHQTVQAGLQLDERAERGDADDLTLDDGAHRILLGGHGPRAGSGLLEGQGNALLLRIDVQDLDVDHVANLHGIGGDVHLLAVDGHQAVADELTGLSAAGGKAATINMYAQGADIVYHAAGGTGMGVIEAAAEQGKFAIGVDQDQNYLAPEAVLTSAVKRVDNGVYNLCKALTEGTLEAGEVVYDIVSGGVDIAETTTLIDADTLAKVEDAKAKILSGEIVVPATVEAFAAIYGEDAYPFK